MHLQNIKHLDCPSCGSRRVMIRQHHKHTNGYWNEDLEFECGCFIHFSPNFMREEFVRQCPFSAAEAEKKDKREKAVKKLENYIKRLDIDEEFKTYITVHGLRVY